ncbi:hypothetical protein FDB61_17830 [Clostridium botulinum]|nr:hypothetical protein [Clostridium botulinum]
MAAEDSTKGISFGAGVLITIGIVSAALVIFNIVMPMLNNGAKKTSSISQRITNSSYTQYDNATLQGSEVIGAVNTQASDDFSVRVKTNSNKSGQVYTTTTYNVTDKDDEDYIEPTEKFKSTLVINDNGAVTGIIFVQQ